MTGPPRTYHSGNLREAYHHGNLRVALIDAGLTLLATRALDELTLREIARAVGVSATAVYRHFPDKRALLAAMAAGGMERLVAAQRDAAAAAGGGVVGFEATGRAYVRFALANPALFRLIFANPAPHRAPAPSGRRPPLRRDGEGDTDPMATSSDEVNEAMALLQASAASLAPQGIDPAALALRVWSLAHGLAMLMLDGQIAAAEATIDAVINATLSLRTGGRS